MTDQGESENTAEEEADNNGDEEERGDRRDTYLDYHKKIKWVSFVLGIGAPVGALVAFVLTWFSWGALFACLVSSLFMLYLIKGVEVIKTNEVAVKELLGQAIEVVKSGPTFTAPLLENLEKYPTEVQEAQLDDLKVYPSEENPEETDEESDENEDTSEENSSEVENESEDDEIDEEGGMAITIKSPSVRWNYPVGEDLIKTYRQAAGQELTSEVSEQVKTLFIAEAGKTYWKLLIRNRIDPDSREDYDYEGINKFTRLISKKLMDEEGFVDKAQLKHIDINYGKIELPQEVEQALHREQEARYNKKGKLVDARAYKEVQKIEAEGKVKALRKVAKRLSRLKLGETALVQNTLEKIAEGEGNTIVVPESFPKALSGLKGETEDPEAKELLDKANKLLGGDKYA